MPINIFGFELGKKKVPQTIEALEPEKTPIKSFIPPDFEDGASIVDFVGGYGFGVQLVNYDIAYRSDAELIIRYRQMAEHSEVQTAIDDIVTQAVVMNDKAETISLNLDKSKLGASVRKKVKREFDEIKRMLKFNTRGNDLFKRWYVDGRLFIQILLDEKKQKKGIVELRPIDPTKIQKVRQIEREVGVNGVKFIKSIKEYYIYTAEDYVGNGRDTINYRFSNEGIILPVDSVAYVNSGFIDTSTRKVLGYLHKAIKPLNQLRMLEDAVVIYRISRAPERRIFYIDVGSLPKNKSEQYVREIMQRYRNKLVYDTTTGELRDEKRHMSMLEDFWMPRREGGKGTEIQTLPGGQNLGEMQDVEYFQKKLYQSLHVPPSRFKEEAGFNMGRAAEISRDEVRFVKFVERLQAKFSELFLQLLRVQLVSKNIMTEDEWNEFSYDFSFDFAKDSYFSELKNNEMMMSRLGALREVEPYIGRFFSNNWVKRNVLQFTDDQIKSMKTEMEKEAQEAPTAPQPGMEGMGMGVPQDSAISPPEQVAPEEEISVPDEAKAGISELEAVVSSMEGQGEGEVPDEAEAGISELEAVVSSMEGQGEGEDELAQELLDLEQAIEPEDEDEEEEMAEAAVEYFGDPVILKESTGLEFPKRKILTMTKKMFEKAVQRTVK